MPGASAARARARDVLIVAGILVLAGIAVADAVRGGDGTEAGAGAETSTTGETDTGRDERFAGVPASGSIILLDDAGCALRQVVVSSGQELPLPRIETGCELWAAPRGGLVAFALDGPWDAAAFRPFRILDLSHPDEPLGTYQTFNGVMWSVDGQHASWCHDPGRGFDFPVRTEDEPRALRGCSVGYAPGERPAIAGDGELSVGGDTVLRAPERVLRAVFNRDGSVTLFLESGLITRAVGGDIVGRLRAPETTGPPAISQDGCDVAFPVAGATVVLGSVCGGAEGTFGGTAAAWSPDGDWLAVAEGDEIVFHHLTGTLGVTRWPVGARALAWVR
jgi:hypothetical protein